MAYSPQRSWHFCKRRQWCAAPSLLADFLLLHFDLEIGGCLPVSSKHYGLVDMRVTSTCSCRDLKQGLYWLSRSKGARHREGGGGSQEIWELEGDECSLHPPGGVKGPKCRKHNDCLCLLQGCWCLWFSSFCLLHRHGQTARDGDSLESAVEVPRY